MKPRGKTAATSYVRASLRFAISKMNIYIFQRTPIATQPTSKWLLELCKRIFIKMCVCLKKHEPIIKSVLINFKNNCAYGWKAARIIAEALKSTSVSQKVVLILNLIGKSEVKMAERTWVCWQRRTHLCKRKPTRLSCGCWLSQEWWDWLTVHPPPPRLRPRPRVREPRTANQVLQQHIPVRCTTPLARGSVVDFILQTLCFMKPFISLRRMNAWIWSCSTGGGSSALHPSSWGYHSGRGSLYWGSYTHTDHCEAHVCWSARLAAWAAHGDDPREAGQIVVLFCVLNNGARHPELEQDAAEAEAQANTELPVEQQNRAAFIPMSPTELFLVLRLHSKRKIIFCARSWRLSKHF